MAGLDSGACLTLLRQTLSDLDTSSTGRWSDSTLVNWIDRANKRMVGEVRFPDCRVSQPTASGIQLYQQPLMLKVKAIYVAGMLIVPSDLPTLEGRQLGYWDNSGGSGGLPPPLGDAPPGSVTGVAAPAWTVAEPLSYPTTNGSWCTPSVAQEASPWTDFQRPKYYWRGGWLGLVPPPSGVTTLDVEGVRQPDTIPYVSVGGVTQPQSMTSPENFLDGIVWAAAIWSFFSNNDQNAREQAKLCETMYQAEKRKMLAWRSEFEGMQSQNPKPRTLRAAFSRNRVRRNR